MSNLTVSCPGCGVEVDAINPRHRKIGSAPVNNVLRPDVLILGLNPSIEDLRPRIESRVKSMLKSGFIEEAEQLGKKFGWENEPHTIYGVVKDYTDGKVTLDQLEQDLVKRHMSLAKRQRTWFRRNKSIHWLKSPQEAIKLTTDFLNKPR